MRDSMIVKLFSRSNYFFLRYFEVNYTGRKPEHILRADQCSDSIGDRYGNRREIFLVNHNTRRQTLWMIQAKLLRGIVQKLSC